MDDDSPPRTVTRGEEDKRWEDERRGRGDPITVQSSTTSTWHSLCFFSSFFRLLHLFLAASFFLPFSSFPAATSAPFGSTPPNDQPSSLQPPSRGSSFVTLTHGEGKRRDFA